MLSGIPSNRLSNLNAVILTNTHALNRKKRRKKAYSIRSKIASNECLGLYCFQRRNEPAYIEILIDNILLHWPNWFLRSNFLTDLMFSDVLFHEIGHHIHATQAPEYNEKENVAEKWQKKLSRYYFWKKYWYFMALLYPFRRIIRWLNNRLKTSIND